MLQPEILRSIIQPCLSTDTSLWPDDCQPGAQYAQCLPVALLIRRNFGGQLLATTNGGARGSHYSNLIFGSRIDVVDDHARGDDVCLMNDTAILENDLRVRNSLAVLERRWQAAIHRALPPPDVEFVAVIPSSQLVRGYLRPDVDVVVLHGAERHSVSDERFFPGQYVWIKLKDGPIVSRSRLVQWTVVSCRDYPRDLLKNLCRAFVGARTESLWADLPNLRNGYWSILRLAPDENLALPITPAARGRLRSLVPLDTWCKKLQWLHADHCDLNLPEDRSWIDWTAPDQHQRYHFKWERALDVEVSLALDERMRRGGRFHDRVEALNRLAALFLITAVQTRTGVVDILTYDEREVLEDALDHIVSTEERDVKELVMTLPSELRALIESDITPRSAAAVLHSLSLIAESMSWVERAVLIDAFYRPTLEMS